MAPRDELERLLLKLPESSQELVQESYAQIGHELSQWDAPALLLDVLLPGAPIVGASQGFHQRSEHFPAGSWRPRSLLGQSVLQVLLKGVDECHISRSMCQDVEDFLRMARLRQLCTMADCVVSHPFHFKGEVLQIKSCFQLLKVKQWHDEGEHNLVLCLLDMDGCKLRLSSQISEHWPNPVLFPAPVSSKCIMLKGMSSVLRREAHLPRGCVCLSHQEIHQQDGSYFFSISVDGTLNSWTSRLPFLGFTCTSPQEIQAKRYFFGDLPHSYCLGDSVHIGGAAEAWLRRGAARAPKLREAVETGAERQLLVPLPDHRRVAPFVPRPGDVLGCRYRRRQAGGVEGSQISLFLNGSLAFEFDLTSELPSGQPLYAVVDVCHCVYQVTMLPNAEDRLMGS